MGFLLWLLLLVSFFPPGKLMSQGPASEDPALCRLDLPWSGLVAEVGGYHRQAVRDAEQEAKFPLEATLPGL